MEPTQNICTTGNQQSNIRLAKQQQPSRPTNNSHIDQKITTARVETSNPPFPVRLVLEPAGKGDTMWPVKH